MTITLEQAKNFTQDKLAQMIIDEFRKDTLLDLMVFDNTVKATRGALTYQYNRVTTLSNAGFRAINTEYESQEAQVTPFTTNLKPFGGKFNVDRVIQNNVEGIVDQITFQIQQKANATKALFTDTFINGDNAIDELSFDGIDKAVTGSSTELIPLETIDLSSSEKIVENTHLFMDQLDKMLASLDGTPSVLLLNRFMGAIMNSIARNSRYFKTSEDAFGRPVTKYADIPLHVLGDKPGTYSPIISINGDGTTPIIALRIGLDGVHAVSPEGENIIRCYLPDMTAPGAVKSGEVEMVTAAVLKATRAAGILRKIKIKPAS